MEFKTAISRITNDDFILRGEKLSRLMRELPFSDVIFLILASRRPNASESKIFNAMLVSIIDHGMGTTSSLATRFTISGGNAINVGVSAGILALGDYHGGAIEFSMKQLKLVMDTIVDRDVAAIMAAAQEFVDQSLANRVTLYGFGHKVYKDHDPRVSELRKIVEAEKFSSPYIELALAVEESLAKAKGKKIPLNIDGFIGSILLAMGFEPKQGKGFFIIGRAPGLVAQAIEEQEREKPVRRISEDEITYDGI